MVSSRRTTELGLVLLSGLITASTYALASLGRSASIPADLGPFLAFVLGLGVFAHLVVRRLAPDADPLLLPLATFLNGMGYVFIVRLSEERGVPDDLPGLQATWIALGVAAFVGTLLFVRRARDLARYQYTFGLLGLLLLVLPLVPGIGREINGAQIWVSIGPVNFQPGEFAKLALAVFFAGYLVEKREVLRLGHRRFGRLDVPELRHFAPIAVAWGASLLVMIVEKDLGSSLLFFALFVVLLWLATERIVYLMLGVGLFAGGAVFTWSLFSHVQDRVDAWIDPWSDRFDTGFQIIEASYALAGGGLTGTGPGRGEPDRVPEIETDFIFAAIGEELGLLGSTAVLSAFLLFVGSGLRIALRAERPFDKLLAAGLTTLIGLQAFIIVGGVVRLVPLTGVTLPFVSYGGSSLLANYVLLALLLRLSGGEPSEPSSSAAAQTQRLDAR